MHFHKIFQMYSSKYRLHSRNFNFIHKILFWLYSWNFDTSSLHECSHLTVHHHHPPHRAFFLLNRKSFWQNLFKVWVLTSTLCLWAKREMMDLLLKPHRMCLIHCTVFWIQSSSTICPDLSVLSVSASTPSANKPRRDDDSQFCRTTRCYTSSEVLQSDAVWELC